jgi:hypothetical protein
MPMWAKNYMMHHIGIVVNFELGFWLIPFRFFTFSSLHAQKIVVTLTLKAQKCSLVNDVIFFYLLGR